LARLLPYTRVFAALDADKAGTLNATRLAALSARVTPVRVPAGNDVTEYHQVGGDVRVWVMAMAGDDTRFPLRVVIPPDEARLPGLAVPAGRWQQPLTLPNQDDGSIVVVYASAEEMAVCREATRVCGERANTWSSCVDNIVKPIKLISNQNSQKCGRTLTVKKIDTLSLWRRIAAVIPLVMLLAMGMRLAQGAPVYAATLPTRAPDSLTQEAVFSIAWNSGCATPPAGAVTALEYAAGIWGVTLASPVTITVSACWTDALPCTGIACGDTASYARNFPQAPMVHTYYPIALANALSGRDLAPAGHDINVFFQSELDWSFATDTAPTTGSDFVTTALHELAHGLGFSGNMYESHNVGFCGNGPYYWYPCPSPYDRLVVDSQGIPLLSYMEPDPRVLGSKLKSDANFGGPNTMLRNNHAWIKLYTPTIWDQGTSLSHLDPSGASSYEDTLMYPTLPSRLRAIGPVTLGIMQDMGWQAAGDAPNLTSTGPMIVGANNPTPFTADLLWAGYAGQPMTYTWTGDAHATITHTDQISHDTALLTWSTPGIKRVFVTATGIATPTAATRAVLVAALNVTGTLQGMAGQPYTFKAALLPPAIGFPITYTWEAAGQIPVTHPDGGADDTVTWTWTVSDTQQITVTALVADATITATHTVHIKTIVFNHWVYLPLVQKQ